MVNIRENVSLKALNTFGIDVNARYFTEIHSEKEFSELLASPVYRSNEKLIIGGGSNILFTKDVEGLVVRNVIKGIHIVKEEGDNVYVRVGAGEVWHDFVMWCIDHNLAGIE